MNQDVWRLQTLQFIELPKFMKWRINNIMEILGLDDEEVISLYIKFLTKQIEEYNGAY